MFETLVALMVAGLALPVLARAMAGAWTATRTPMETVSAIALARDVAAGSDIGVADAGRQGFAVERAGDAVKVLVLPSRVAPAPEGSGEPSADPVRRGVPAGMKLAMPESFATAGPGAAAPRRALRRVTVVVRTPSGRRIAFDSVRFSDAPP